MFLEFNTIREAVPSLVFSFVGLVLMGKALEAHSKDPFTKYIPHVFIINSMLTFKNNIELNYADIMSTSTKRLFSLPRAREQMAAPLQYVLESGAKMFFNSVVVSLAIGAFASYKHLGDLFFTGSLGYLGNAKCTLAILMISFLAGTCSSLLVFVFVVFCIYLSIRLDLDPDNIILPVISTVADYVSTVSMIYFANRIFLVCPEPFVLSYGPGSSAAGLTMTRAEVEVFFTNCAMLVILALLIIYFHFLSRDRVACSFFKVPSLLATFVISMAAGWLVQHFAELRRELGVLIPPFNGLAGSVILIYISKLTTYYNSFSPSAPPSAPGEEAENLFKTPAHGGLEHMRIEDPSNRRMFCTLMCTALLIAGLSILSMRLLFNHISALTSALFVALLVVQVLILFVATYLFLRAFIFLGYQLDCNMVPIMNASSDLIGTLVFSLGVLGTRKLLRVD